MKLALNIEFDSWEDLAQFSFLMQNRLSQPISKPLKVSKRASKKPKTRTYKKIEKPGQKSFQPPEEMLEKVDEYLKKGYSFSTQDVAGKFIMSNPNRRAKANKWLQSHPKLVFSHQKGEKERGRGRLVYAPAR